MLQGVTAESGLRQWEWSVTFCNIYLSGRGCLVTAIIRAYTVTIMSDYHTTLHENAKDQRLLSANRMIS